MESVASVVEVLSDFGAAAGWLIAALVPLAYRRPIHKENGAAHAALAESVREEGKRLDELGGTLHAIARDVAVLRNRSERAGA